MEHITLGCQVCLATFDSVGQLKAHLYSQEHKKKSQEVFKHDFTFVTKHSVCPTITLFSQRSKGGIPQPIIGLTLCFSRKSHASFYLCQICEEKCPSDRIVSHLLTIDHCRNYFSHTNPNALRFSWIPSMNVKGVFRHPVTQEVKGSGGGQLQLLDLPGRLCEKLNNSTYSEVMRTFSENEKLLELLQAVKPKQMLIQTYQRDSNREHPLLGMQHLVECICVGQTEKRRYLCTLCHLTLAAHAIVKHVLSFDHIFCYFRAWHPSTLLVKESYKDYSLSFASMMLDFAKQTEQIHGTANADMTQVSLEPTKFTSVNFTCYADALKELESIRRENKESSLIVSVTPGKTLVLKEPESKEKENKESSLMTSVTPGIKLELRPGMYKLCCQNCSMSFLNMPQYCRHVSNYTHKQRVKKFFGGGSICFPPFPSEWKPSLGLYENLINGLWQNRPLGIALVVTCVCTQIQEEPIYVCFACQDCFPESFLSQHFDSQKHLIHTLLYQNPWRLPLGWKHRLDAKHLRSMALEEEEEKPDQRMLKVLDMPKRMFQTLFTLNFQEVMKSLSLQHIILKRDVPPYETYSKLKENDRFPLLGRQFLVRHNVCVVGQQPTMASLCLLCERRLSDEECYAHEFSRKHITTYLDRFHPGSLDSSTDDESFLDLAKQAARYHSISHMQVITLQKPIREPCTYSRALYILTSANNREWQTQLDPPIIPKMKLVPRKKLKDEDKDHERDIIQKNGRMMECLEPTNQEFTDNSESTLKKTVEVGAEVTDSRAIKSEENAEKGDDKETLTVFHLTSEKGRGACSEDVQTSETCQATEEKIEIPTSGEATENGQNADKNEIRNERNKSSKAVLTQKKDISQKDTCPVEAEGQEKDHKQQRLTFKEEPQNLPISGQREVTTLDKRESGKPSHKTAKDKASSKVDQQQADQLWQYLKRKHREPVVGLSALLECICAEHDPIYLCKCCSLKIPEKDIISHVTAVDHQKMYLVGLKKIPPPPGMNQGKTMRHFAGLFEREHGYGAAQVVELDDEIYNNLSKQDFDSVIQTVKALQDQQDSGHELPSTSALSGGQLVVSFMRDSYEVLKMATDDSEDPEARSSSVTTSMSIKTETTSKTTKVPPDSNEAHGKASRSPGLSPNTLSKSSENKAEIISNTTVGPFKIAATSNVVGRSETSCHTANPKSRETASKCTATTSTSSDSTSSDTISRTTSTTTSATLSKTLESRTRAATEVRTASCKAAAPSKAESTVVFEAAGRTAPGFKIENASKYSESESKIVVASQTAVKSVATAKMTETSVATHLTMPKNPPATHLTMPKDPPATHLTMPKTPPATHLTMPKNPPATHLTMPKDPPATHLTMPKDPPATHLTMPKDPPATHLTMPKDPPATHLTMPKDPPATHLTMPKDPPATHLTMPKNPPATHLTMPKNPPATHLTMPKNPPATHLTMPKNPPAEPSHICTNEKRPSGSSLKVGLNQLIKVSCGQRKQVYCQLCSVRLLKSEHACSASHQLNYVKMKYPQWICKPSELESKLQEAVKNLAVVETNVGSLSFPTVKVTIDVYKELADLSAEKALERLKAMLESGLGVSSPTTSNPGGVLRRQVSGADQHEASSQDDEIESSLKEEGFLAVGPFHRAQSVESSEAEAGDQILDQLNSCSILNKDLVNPCIQDVGVAAAKMERPQGCAPPPATDAQTPTCKETPGWKQQQQERSHPEIQDTRKVLEGSRRTSPVNVFNSDQLSSAATVNTKKQNQPRPSQKAENALPMILLGESTEVCSHLSIYLKVKGPDCEPIIGMDFVWECRGPSSNTFYLCESCNVMLSFNDIYQHMISKDHQINFISSQKSQFLYFWSESYVLQHPDMYLEEWMKLELLKDIVQCLSEQERYVKTVAQVILLGPEMYERVRTATFSKALEIVKNIKKDLKLSVSCQPSCTPQRKVQLPEAQQSPEESLSTEMQPAQALETNQRSDDEQPDPRPSVSPHQRPIQELPVKQAGVRPESASFSVVCPPTLSVSSSDQHLPTRKRPVAQSNEKLTRLCTNHPDLKDPMPAKRKPTYNELQPIIQPSPESVSESTSVNPAATSVPLSPQDKDTAHGSDEQDIAVVDSENFDDLIALVKARKSALKASRCAFAPGNGETTTSCANGSLKSGVQRRRDPKSVQTTSKRAMKRRRRRDENLKMFKETKNPAPAYALEEKFNSSLDCASSARGDLLFGATEAKAVGTMLPYASTADPSDPQHQRSIYAQTTFENTSQSNPSPINCAVINSDPGHIPQPRDYTENNSTGVHQLPINAIVTVRSNQPKRQFIGGNNEEDLTEVNRGSLVTHRFSSVAEICPSDVLGRYGQYNQMVYVTNRQSGYFASNAVGSYSTPGNPPVHTGSSFQFEGYPRGGLYFPSQIHPDQETARQSLQYFGSSLATQTPPEWVRLGMQQQKWQHDQ